MARHNRFPLVAQARSYWEAPFEHRRTKEWKLSDDPYSYLAIGQPFLMVQGSRQRTNSVTEENNKAAVYISPWASLRLWLERRVYRDHDDNTTLPSVLKRLKSHQSILYFVVYNFLWIWTLFETLFFSRTNQSLFLIVNRWMIIIRAETRVIRETVELICRRDTRVRGVAHGNPLRR